MLPILTHHDRSRLEIWALDSGGKNDEIQQKLQAVTEHWLDISNQLESKIGQIIEELQLDVLIELGGFSKDSKISSIVERRAPIQLSYLGYPGPTYLSNIDGWIGDEILFSSLNSVDKSAHTLHLIEGGYMSLGDHHRQYPILKAPKPRPFQFGSFNHSRKLTPETVSLWVSILNSNQNSELTLKSINFVEHEEKKRVERLFYKAGLDIHRLNLLDGTQSIHDHLDAYHQIDVALDPIPYGGATTTCEALEMGVPVISLSGLGMIGQLSASLLVHSGCHEWLAQTKSEYCKIANLLCQHGKRSYQDRADLQKKIRTSQLGNNQRLAQNLEKLYFELKNAKKVK